jgi:GxxExxY protein
MPREAVHGNSARRGVPPRSRLGAQESRPRGRFCGLARQLGFQELPTNTVSLRGLLEFSVGWRLAMGGSMKAIATVSQALTELIIACAIAVHEQLGPGFLEAVYQQCLEIEFRGRGLQYIRERTIPLVYRGVPINALYRLDFVVEGAVLVEVKSVQALAPVHRAQAINYLKLTGLPVALLMNFNVPLMKNGIRRLVHPDFYGKDSELIVPPRRSSPLP